MLNLESRTEILGMTVYQDTDNESQFYYLPGSPHITYANGDPMFDLFTYRKGGEASKTLSGGFLNMSVDLGIGSLKKRIEDKLKEQYGSEVKLAPVPITRGTVRVIALGEDSKALSDEAGNETKPDGSPLINSGPRFIEKILGSGKPSLYGDNNAIFSFSLNEDGTAFFLSILNGRVDARPVGVIYDLDYVGLLPAYELEITIDFKSCYEYTRKRFTLGTLLFKADIDSIIEELQRREAIKVREVSRTLELSKPEAIRERQAHIDQLVKDLATGALFQPSLIPGEPRVKGDTITAADPTTSVSPQGEESSAMSALRNGPAAAVVAAQGEAYGRAANPEGRAPASSSGEPSEGTSGVSSGGSTSGTSGTTSDGSSTSAASIWNSLGRPQAAYVYKNISQQEQRTVTYDLSQVTAQQQTVAPQSLIQFMAGGADLNKRVHLVDLNHPFFQRLNINVNARDVDFTAEGIVQMTVQLRYGKRANGTGPKDTAEVILRSKDDSKDFTFFTDKDLAQSYEYKLIVDYMSTFGMGAKEPRVESDWIMTESRSLSVHPGWLRKMLPVTVQLAPNMPSDVAEAQVRVHYTSPSRGVSDSTTIQLTTGRRSQVINIRLADDREQYDVATTLYYTDGAKEELPAIRISEPASGSDIRTVVINAPASNRINGDVIMQDPLDELQSVLVDAELRQNGTILYAHNFELTGPKKRETWYVRLPDPSVKPILRYHERRFYKDSGLEDLDWRESPTPNVVVGIPAIRVMPVYVRYAGPKLSELGLSMVLLDLSYSDPNGDSRYDQSASRLITDDPATHDQEWKIRLSDNTARVYKWKLTFYMANGKESSTEYATTESDKLILRVPQL